MRIDRCRFLTILGVGAGAAALPLFHFSSDIAPSVAPGVKSRSTPKLSNWEALAISPPYGSASSEYWSTFHAGVPEPRIPLLLHAALKKEGSAAREDWLRIIDFLQLKWDSAVLPPDHLGIACEVTACALEQERAVTSAICYKPEGGAR